MKEAQKSESDEYYFNENGLMVMTALHHLKRGYCCGNACKHCPYDYERVAPDLRAKLLAARKDNNT